MKLQPFDSSSLSALGDILLTSVTNGDVLYYQSSSSKWINGSLNTAGIVALAGSQTITGSKTISVAAGSNLIKFQNNSGDTGYLQVVAPASWSGQTTFSLPTTAAAHGQYLQIQEAGSIDTSRWTDVEVDTWRLEYASSTSLRLVGTGRYTSTSVYTGRININGEICNLSSDSVTTLTGLTTNDGGVTHIYAYSSSGTVVLESSTGTGPTGNTGNSFAYKIKSADATRRYVGCCRVASNVIVPDSVFSANRRTTYNKPKSPGGRLMIGFSASNGDGDWNTDGSPKHGKMPDIPSRGTQNITGATNATPIVITCVGHQLQTGMRIFMSGVSGNTAANGTWNVTKVDADTFSLDSSVGNGAYTANGSFYIKADTVWYVPYNDKTAMVKFGHTDEWEEVGIPDNGIYKTPAWSDNTNYDIFANYSGGTIELTNVAWSSATARNVSLATADGIIYRNSTSPAHIYLGTVRTLTATNQALCDYPYKRYCFSMYNRVRKDVRAIYADSSWTYNTATWQNANANANNYCEVLCGVEDSSIDLTCQAYSYHNEAASAAAYPRAIGISTANSTTTLATNQIVGVASDGYRVAGGFERCLHTAKATERVPVGLSKYYMMEYGIASGATTFYGIIAVGSVGYGGIVGTWIC